ncbi:MAG: EamA family transporter [Rhodospirillales bacterium]|nr:EamA family transporter [Rhodospirillales bacterium]
MTPASMLAALVVVVIWGLNFVAAKVGVTAIPPLAFMAIRFFLVALLLAPFFRPRRSHFVTLLVISTLLGVGHFGLMFLGINGVDAATAAIANQLVVPFSAIMAAMFFNDRLGWRRSGGMALAFSGVALLAGEPTLPAILPLLMVVSAALAWAVANVAIKKLGAVPPLVMNGWMALFAAPQLLLLSLIFEEGQTAAVVEAAWTAWAALAFTVLGASIIAYTLWYQLVTRYDLNQIVPFTLLGPVIGVASGIVLLGEPFTWQKAVGGALTILGVAIIQMGAPRRRRSPSENEARA